VQFRVRSRWRALACSSGGGEDGVMSAVQEDGVMSAVQGPQHRSSSILDTGVYVELCSRRLPENRLRKPRYYGGAH